MTIGDRIKAKRNQLRLTLEDIAKRTGVSRQTIQKYESGVITNIPSDKIEAIASVLGTTPAYLMGWENKGSNVEDLLDKNENRLLSYYRKLDNNKRDELLRYARFISNEEKETDFDEYYVTSAAAFGGDTQTVRLSKEDQMIINELLRQNDKKNQ